MAPLDKFRLLFSFHCAISSMILLILVSHLELSKKRACSGDSGVECGFENSWDSNWDEVRGRVCVWVLWFLLKPVDHPFSEHRN